MTVTPASRYPCMSALPLATHACPPCLSLPMHVPPAPRYPCMSPLPLATLASPPCLDFPPTSALTTLLFKFSPKKHEGPTGSQFPGTIGGGRASLAYHSSDLASSGRLTRPEAVRRTKWRANSANTLQGRKADKLLKEE